MKLGGSGYWALVAAYVFLLFAVQPFLGIGVDLFKELWGETLLDRLAYGVIGLGALAVAVGAARFWRRVTLADGLAVAAALVVYGVGTLTAGSPQERLHYLEYGLLAGLLYFGLAWPRLQAVTAAPRPELSGSTDKRREPSPSSAGGAEGARRAHREAPRPAAAPTLSGPAIAGALLIGGGLGLLDELLQIAWPRRYFDWRDVGINVAAVAFGLLVAVPLLRAARR